MSTEYEGAKITIYADDDPDHRTVAGPDVTGGPDVFLAVATPNGLGATMLSPDDTRKLAAHLIGSAAIAERNAK